MRAARPAATQAADHELSDVHEEFAVAFTPCTHVMSIRPPPPPPAPRPVVFGAARHTGLVRSRGEIYHFKKVGASERTRTREEFVRVNEKCFGADFVNSPVPPGPPTAVIEPYPARHNRTSSK